jgi:threonine/homoserine/homoserine lactone efflux protein
MVVALGIVLTPGPNMIYLVSRSITQGRRAGLISLCGVAVGFMVYLVATNLGLTVVFTEVPQVYMAVKLAGAVYLAWLACKALKPGGISVFTPEKVPDDSPRRLFTMGLTTNLLNPKIAIMCTSRSSRSSSTSRRVIRWRRGWCSAACRSWSASR